MAQQTIKRTADKQLFARLAAALALPACTWFALPLYAQPVPSDVPQGLPVPDEMVEPAPLVTNQDLQAEIWRMREELNQSRASREEVQRLRDEVAALRTKQEQQQASGAQGASTRPPGQASGIPAHYHSGAFGPSQADRPDADDFPVVRARYGYNSDATGPLGGGGYFSAATADDVFSVKLTNQITVDGTFYSKNGLPTNEQGFNIPFARTFIYGNITKNFSYQVGTQGFIGTFNLLDSWMAWHISDKFTLRAGKGLTPPLFEYYAFSPALEPVITNSPLFQLAAKRPIGLMGSGTLFENRMQWWSGVTNSGTSLFGNLDNNVDYNGAVTFTPFRGDRWRQTFLEGLGAGLGFSVGKQRYQLAQSSIAFTNNGEATTNAEYVTVVGLPFYVYNSNVRTDGLRYRAAPHLFWFGRASFLAEYMFHRRELTDGTNGGKSTQHAYYVNGSFWLTGERDYKGTGLQGYSTVEPIRPFSPVVGNARGWGAWQVAAQWAQFFAGNKDMERGLVDMSRSTSRMDNLMVGLNWWPNKYVRISVDYVRTWFNHSVPLKADSRLSMYQTAWTRAAMFF